jgi:hypothetical protein
MEAFPSLVSKVVSRTLVSFQYRWYDLHDDGAIFQ